MGEIDLLVVGGAIGASWGGPAGWAAFIYAPQFHIGRKFVEAKDDTTQRQADLLPFVAAVQWFHDHLYQPGMTPRILCCSDSTELVNAGQYPTLRDHSSEDWAYIAWFEKQGYAITWVCQHRDQHPNVFEEAERARELFARSIAAR